jgi:hypothetical protein
VVIVFALVPYRKDSHSRIVFDLEQGNVSRRTEWNDDFTQERVVPAGLAAGERKVMKEFGCLGNCITGAPGGLEIVLNEKAKKAPQVFPCAFRVADLEAQGPEFS